MFTFELIKEDEKKVAIYFEGDLDIEVTEMMEEEIIPALQPFTTISINLSQVPFVDSTGIGLLINLIDTLKKNNESVTVTISGVQSQVKDIFEIIQLPEILGEEIFV